MIRRAVVAGVLLLIVVGAAVLMRSVIGDDDGDVGVGVGAPTGSVGADPPAAGSLGTTAPTAGATTTATGPASPASTAPAEPDTPRVPSASDPARVLLVGDSEAQGLEPFLETVFDDVDLTTLSTEGRNSTGLVRSDYFDWPEHLRTVIPQTEPDIVVAFFGGNDGQPFVDMQSKPVGSPEWREEYGKRVGETMDYLRADGRTLIWIGVPIPGEAGLRERLTAQNEVVVEQAASRPDVVFIDSWQLFAGIDGGYATHVFDPLNQTYAVVRSDRDEFHLNVAGTKILAAAVGDAIFADLTARGAVGAPEPLIDLSAAGTYTIAANDSISGIAAKTGTTVDAIVAANGWAGADQLITVGQKIELPARSTSP